MALQPPVTQAVQVHRTYIFQDVSGNKAVPFWRRSISVDMFQKAMDLDLRWHLMRKTGEVTRIMDRGTSAIQQVLSTGRIRSVTARALIRLSSDSASCSVYAFLSDAKYQVSG